MREQADNTLLTLDLPPILPHKDATISSIQPHHALTQRRRTRSNAKKNELNDTMRTFASAEDEERHYCMTRKSLLHVFSTGSVECVHSVLAPIVLPAGGTPLDKSEISHTLGERKRSC